VILPPLGVIILEGIVLRTSHFAGLIGHHIVGLMGLMVGKSGFAVHDMADSTMPSHVGHIMSMESVFWFILQPEMWIGVVIGAAFVAGAIWLRRHRFEF
jgi:ABC-2 type transport system permease protein